jgi:hypothetical protein
MKAELPLVRQSEIAEALKVRHCCNMIRAVSEKAPGFT